ncbi:GNAT family N-acetyltransferase [Spirillospora sp. NBC_00431]
MNVAWDGGDHAFLIDTKTRGSYQHRGIGTAVVRLAAAHARAAGCEWLHVDFEPELRPFYVDACGFRPTEAALIHLSSLRDRTWRRVPRISRVLRISGGSAR